jgi:hypothetical protein
MGDNSSAPVVAGVHWFITAPCGMKQRPSLICGRAAVCARSVRAGTIASRNGSDMVTPTPRMNVRRERCFLNRAFIWSP